MDMDELKYDAHENTNCLPETPNLGQKVDEVASVDKLSKLPQQVAEMETDRKMQEIMEKHGRKTPVNNNLSPELKTGYRILLDLMHDSNKAANWPFMESLEVSNPSLVADYRKTIEKPIWLKLMKQKFDSEMYSSITEFVADFRTMLENCYRYNGPDHYISKRAQKLETMLEQKLTLLSREMRAKTSIAATSGHPEMANFTHGLRRRPKSLVRHDSTLLLSQLREAELQRERELRRQMIVDRRAEKEALASEIVDWEDKVLFQGTYKAHMKSMWELPQIGLFLFLCQSPLNVGEVMHFELERCFMMPRESSTMQVVMTSLLSTPFQRLKIDKKTLMPYKVWEQKLRTKLQVWYKVYTDFGHNPEKVFVKLGVEPQFFDIVGQRNPLERRRYHELSYYRRVCIVKALCDFCLHSQDSLREMIELHPLADQREYVLGTDGDGWRYIHFPQFCGADLRIYRQAPFKYPKLEINIDTFDNRRKFPLVYKPPPKKRRKKEKRREKPPVSPITTRQRPSRLRQTPKTIMPVQMAESSDSSSSTDDADDENEGSTDKGDDSDTKDAAADSGDNKSSDRLSSCSDVTIPYCDRSDQEPSETTSAFSSRDCSRESSPYLSPLDLGLRRSVRLEHRSDVSRESSPLIGFDLGLRRSTRKLGLFKDIMPQPSASRNLNNFLFDENSNSNSSAFGENSQPVCANLRIFKSKFTCDENSISSSVDDENSCDTKDLFSNSYKTNGAFRLNDITDSPDNTSNSQNIETTNLENSLKSVYNGHNWTGSTTDNSVSKDSVIPNNDSAISESVTETTGKGFLPMFGQISDSLNNFLDTRSDVDSPRLTIVEDQDSNMSGSCDNSQKPPPSTDSVLQGDVLDNHVDSYCGNDTHADEAYVARNSISDNCTTGDLTNHCSTQLSDTIVTSVEISSSLHDSVNHSTSNPSDSTTAYKTHVDGGIDDDFDTEMMDELVVTKPIHSREDTTQLPDIVDSNRIKDEHSDTAIGNKSDMDVTVKMELEVPNENYSESKNENLIKTKSEVLSDLKTEINEPNITSDDKGSISKVKIEIDRNIIESVYPAEGESKSNIDELNEVAKQEIKQEKGEDECPDGEKKADVKEEMDETKVKEESDVESEEEEKVPDASQFELMSDSVDGLRQLAEEFEEPEPIVNRRGKKEQLTKPPSRKRCVVLLHGRLKFLLKELEPWESKLLQATKRARIRLRKEREDYVEPPNDPDTWDTTDEETQSGTSGDESDNENDGQKKTKHAPLGDRSSRGNVSGCSTPVKLEDFDETDISQRGRLRKRRIIPNNVEDQFCSKKLKSVIKTEPPTCVTVTKATTPSKPVLVSYSDILKQLKAITMATSPMTTTSQIVIQTAQGQKTLLTGILPAGVQNIQSIRLVSPPAGQSQSTGQPVKIAMATSKQSQHPMIQHLLAKAPGPTQSGIPQSTGLSTLQHILPHSAAGQVTQKLLLPQLSSNPDQAKTPLKIQLPLHSPSPPGQGQGQITPNQFVVHNTSPQKRVNTIKPPIVAMPTTTMLTPTGKVKYYAANASTLPINVVQQLLATRGAKLQSGPNQESILFIPMEEDGNMRNVVSDVKNVPIQLPVSQISPRPVETSGQRTRFPSGSHVTVTQASGTGISLLAESAGTVITSLAEVQRQILTSPILTTIDRLSETTQLLNQGLNQGNLSSENNQLSTTDLQTSNRIIHGQNIVSGVKLATTSTVGQQVKIVGLTNAEHRIPVSRYPNNETVRNLLDKRKVGEEKLSPDLNDSSDNSSESVGNQASCSFPPPQTVTVIDDTQTTLDTTTFNYVQDRNDSEVKGLTSPTNQQAGITKPVQCVYTSISPAKLNSLLLQTTAAGAKSFPSLIKLPSKAVLDSAVKAVVTAAPTTLPTVNIKVPSPATLPSVAPRRNVTKTVQTMRTPISVAPKVVTKSSGSADHSTRHTSPPGAVGVTNVAATQAMAVVQNIGGKNVLTKIVPQTLLTSQGLVQGYVTPKGFVIPKTQPACTQPATALLNQIGQQTMKQVPVQSNSLQIAQSQVPSQSSHLIQNQAVMPAMAAYQQTGTRESNIKPGGLLMSHVQMPPQNNLIVKSSGTHTVPIAPATSKTVNYNQSVVGRHISKLPVSPISAACIAPKAPVLGLAPSLGMSTLAGSTPFISHSLASSTAMQSPIPGTSFILPSTIPSGMTSAPISTSPMMNLPQGYIMQGAGMQLTNPVVNQMGLNLLQPGVPFQQTPGVIPQSLTTQPTSLGPPGLKQMVNPLLMSPALVGQPQGSTGIAGSTAFPGTNATQLTSHASAAHLGIKREVTAVRTTPLNTVIAPQPSPTGQLLMRSPQNGGESLRSFSAASEIVKQLAAAQLQTKPPIMARSVPEVKPVLLQQQLNAPVTVIGSSATSSPLELFPSYKFMLAPNKPHIATGSMSAGTCTSPAVANCTVQGAIETPRPCGIVMNSSSNITAPTPNQVIRASLESQGLNPAKPSTTEVYQAAGSQQQKLMLFSIGGQLVTGQGVPVTLDNGVLKLMPQAKVQIANQTLTPKQIQQTLTKIGQATNTALSQPAPTIGLEVPPSNQQSDPTVSMLNRSPTENMKTSQTNINISHADHSYPHKPGTTNLIRTLAVPSLPNSCAAETSATVTRPWIPNVQFVLKPMVYSSGYIVCPKVAGKDSTPGSNERSVIGQTHLNTVSNTNVISPKISTPSLSELKSHIPTQVITNSTPETSSSFLNINGQVQPGVSNTHENLGDLERAKLRESIEGRSYHPLMSDDGSHEKEAALNLLSLANQAIGREFDASSGSSKDMSGK